MTRTGRKAPARGSPAETIAGPGSTFRMLLLRRHFFSLSHTLSLFSLSRERGRHKTIADGNMEAGYPYEGMQKKVQKGTQLRA